MNKKALAITIVGWGVLIPCAVKFPLATTLVLVTASIVFLIPFSYNILKDFIK